MARGYVIGDIEVTDPGGYDAYKALSTAAVERYGGRFVVRGGASEVLEGDVSPHRVVVIEFDSPDAARRWWDSPEYAAAAQVRRANSTGWFLVTEGVPDPGD
jgi:uncharacterized protein (DUF1330 family)